MKEKPTWGRRERKEAQNVINGQYFTWKVSVRNKIALSMFIIVLVVNLGMCLVHAHSEQNHILERQR
jgi:hypothetical protein